MPCRPGLRSAPTPTATQRERDIEHDQPDVKGIAAESKRSAIEHDARGAARQHSGAVDRHHGQRPSIPDAKHGEEDRANDPCTVASQCERIPRNSSHYHSDEQGDTERDGRPYPICGCVGHATIMAAAPL